ncbi:MAG: hypothetical protein ACI82Z_001720, partial [Cellvibrionaceae bacterium]
SVGFRFSTQTTELRPSSVSKIKDSDPIDSKGSDPIDSLCDPIDYEYTFRFNRRSSKTRGLLFYRLMQHAVAMKPITYLEMVKNHDRKI